jgi:hypothetical protein
MGWLSSFVGNLVGALHSAGWFSKSRPTGEMQQPVAPSQVPTQLHEPARVAMPVTVASDGVDGDVEGSIIDALLIQEHYVNGVLDSAEVVWMLCGDQWIAASWFLSEDAMTLLFDLQDAPPEPFSDATFEVRISDLGLHIGRSKMRIDDVTTRPTSSGAEVVFTFDDGTTLQYQYDWTTLSSGTKVRSGAYVQVAGLLRQWDPIGVYDDSTMYWPDDEYDIYVADVIAAVRRGASADDVAVHLERIQVERMELQPTPDRNRSVAEAIVTTLRRQSESHP